MRSAKDGEPEPVARERLYGLRRLMEKLGNAMAEFSISSRGGLLGCALSVGTAWLYVNDLEVGVSETEDGGKACWFSGCWSASCSRTCFSIDPSIYTTSIAAFSSNHLIPFQKHISNPWEHWYLIKYPRQTRLFHFLLESHSLIYITQISDIRIA